MRAVKKIIWGVFLLNVGLHLSIIGADSFHEWDLKKNTSFIFDFPMIDEKQTLVIKIEEDYARSPVLEAERKYAIDPALTDYKLLQLWKVLEDRSSSKVYYVFYINSIKDIYAVYVVDKNEVILDRFLLSDFF